MRPKRSNPNRRRRAFTLVDVIFSVLLLAMGSLTVAALMPTMARGQHMSDETSKATQIAAKEIELLRLVGYDNLTRERLEELGLIDVTEEPDMTFSTLPEDHAMGFSPASVLRDGRGVVEIYDVDPVVREVIVTVYWTSAAGKPRSVSLTTMVGKY
jgi:type II secretory pathway pseudopilin PulG